MARKRKPTKSAPKKGRKAAVRRKPRPRLAPSTARTRRDTQGWRERFLKELAATCNVTLACQAAGIDRRTAYDHKKENSSFAEKWDDALDTAVDMQEAEARRRAIDGVERPMFYQGEQIGVERVYSDALMIFLLKAHRPEKYRERVSVKNENRPPGGDGGGPGFANKIAAFLSEIQSAAAAEGSGTGAQGG